MRIMYKEQPKIGGGADSIENYLSKILGGWRPPKLAGGKPHDVCVDSYFNDALQFKDGFN